MKNDIQTGAESTQFKPVASHDDICLTHRNEVEAASSMNDHTEDSSHGLKSAKLYMQASNSRIDAEVLKKQE